jgi:TPR repeat protein
VENELPEAILYLGQLYDQGDSFYRIVQNPKKAVKLYKRAAELGNVEAMHGLARAYEQGRGVKHADTNKAKQLYYAGVNRGYTSAHYNLANLLFRELRSGVLDLRTSANRTAEAHSAMTGASEIFRLYDLAAMNGHKAAIYMKGMCYQVGVGVTVDHVEARRWLERAAAEGHQLAIDQLAKIDAEEATS